MCHFFILINSCFSSIPAFRQFCVVETSYFQFALAAVVLAAGALARPDGPHAHAPPAYGASAPYAAPEYPDVPPQYAYTYAVKDDVTYTNFDAQEQRDGYSTAGSYRSA
jgi:hypothetical protein